MCHVTGLENSPLKISPLIIYNVYVKQIYPQISINTFIQHLCNPLSHFSQLKVIGQSCMFLKS